MRGRRLGCCDGLRAALNRNEVPSKAVAKGKLRIPHSFRATYLKILYAYYFTFRDTCATIPAVDLRPITVPELVLGSASSEEIGRSVCKLFRSSN